MTNNITALLNDVGLMGQQRKKQKDISIDERLNNHGLGLDELIPILFDILTNDDTPAHTKVNIARDVFKMHGVLKENPQSAVTPVTIVINDNGNRNLSINPILIPRELHLVESSLVESE